MWNPFNNPFAKPDAAKFAESVVPLSQVSHEHHSADKETASTGTNEKGSSGRGSPTRTSLSIEILKSEVDNDVSVNGHNTAYDRMYTSTSLRLSWTYHSVTPRDPTLCMKILTVSRQIQAHQHCHSGHGHG